MATERENLVLRINDLSVGFGKRTVLKDVNFELRAGEFWFFIGPNGVGKSTLINIFLGVLQPQQGKMFLNPEFAHRSLIGFVPQRCDLNPTLPIAIHEFVLMGLADLRAKKKERNARLSWALEKMRLQDMEEKNYWSLSGGQRQRALVARALIRRPKLLIADEPTKDLDLPATNALMECLTDLNQKENLTVLLVTHDLNLAARYCTHAALFVNGSVRTGICQVVLNSENLERAYGVPVSIGHEVESQAPAT
jgi:ABC-type Mn2+/Zn2+ transport system ATPase subunit